MINRKNIKNVLFNYENPSDQKDKIKGRSRMGTAKTTHEITIIDK
jgi:hypothetical protein